MVLMHRDNEAKWVNESFSECLEIWREKLSEHYDERLRELEEEGLEWEDIVNNHHETLLTQEDIERIDDEIIEEGYQYTPAANVSLEEEPEKYEQPEGI
jgi:hypothetical protein